MRMRDQHTLRPAGGAGSVHTRQQLARLDRLRRGRFRGHQLVETHNPETAAQTLGGHRVPGYDQGAQRGQRVRHLRHPIDVVLLADQRSRTGVVQDMRQEPALVGGVDRNLDHPAEPDTEQGMHRIEGVVQQHRHRFPPPDAETRKAAGQAQGSLVGLGERITPVRPELGELVGHLLERPVIGAAQRARRDLRQTGHPNPPARHHYPRRYRPSRRAAHHFHRGAPAAPGTRRPPVPASRRGGADQTLRITRSARPCETACHRSGPSAGWR